MGTSVIHIYPSGIAFTKTCFIMVECSWFWCFLVSMNSYSWICHIFIFKGRYRQNENDLHWYDAGTNTKFNLEESANKNGKLNRIWTQNKESSPFTIDVFCLKVKFTPAYKACEKRQNPESNQKSALCKLPMSGRIREQCMSLKDKYEQGSNGHALTI